MLPATHPMEHTKKMVLVPYDSYTASKMNNIQQQDTNPLNEKMVSLDKDMESVLKDSALSSMQKVNKYAKIMQEYMEYRRKQKAIGLDNEVPKETVLPMDAEENVDSDASTQSSDNENKPNLEDKGSIISTPSVEENIIQPLHTEEKDHLPPLQPPLMSKAKIKRQNVKNIAYDFTKTWLHI
jgi:hypothetical protein